MPVWLRKMVVLDGIVAPFAGKRHSDTEQCAPAEKSIINMI
jgi:hypothetical protein